MMLGVLEPGGTRGAQDRRTKMTHGRLTERNLESMVYWAGMVMFVGLCLVYVEPCACVPQPADPLSGIVSAMYNAKYAQAQAMLQKWVESHPEDFRAWNYLAETVLDQEMVHEGLYTGEAYGNSGIAFRKRERPVSPGFESKLNPLLDRAQQLESQRLSRNPNDEEAIYWLGVTYSTRTEYEFAINRSYLAALKEGKQALKLNKRLLKMDPQFLDAYFVIGLADYAEGSLPWYFKVIASIAGVHGNRLQGIAELKRAGAGGRYTRVDAKIVLVAIYEREKQYSQALSLLEDLHQQFPGNYLAPLEIARVEKAQGDWRQAAAVYDGAVKEYVDDVRDPSQAPRAAILLKAGEAHEHLGETERALGFYRRAGREPGHDAAVYQADLAAARLDASLHRSDQAKKEYQAVIDAAPGSDWAKQAREGLARLH